MFSCEEFIQSEVILIRRFSPFFSEKIFFFDKIFRNNFFRNRFFSKNVFLIPKYGIFSEHANILEDFLLFMKSIQRSKTKKTKMVDILVNRFFFVTIFCRKIFIRERCLFFRKKIFQADSVPPYITNNVIFSIIKLGLMPWR